MSYLEQYFQDMGFHIQELPEYEPMVDGFIIEHRNPNLWTVFRWDARSSEKDFFNSIQNKLKAVLLNGDVFEKDKIYDREKLQFFIDFYYPKLSPDEKLDSIIEYVSNLTSYEGQPIALPNLTDDSAIRLFFSNKKEWMYYLESARDLGLLKKTVPERDIAHNLTISGLTRLLKIKENKDSRYCFIAMAFRPETSIIRNAIKEALVETGFLPLIIDEQNIESDRTINDEIIASLKKCRFCIADFSYHSKGVYFESGFALGQGKKVIYTCLDREFNDAHFDIKPLQHIIYSTAEQLKKDLIHKIEAWII